MTVDDLQKAIALLKRQNTWLRWKAESRKQARQSKQSPGSGLSPYQGPESAPEEEQEAKGDYERPAFSVPGLDRVLIGTEREAERLIDVYQL